MHRDAGDRRTSLLDPSLRAATIGAVSLVSVLAFEAMAVATAMPAIAEALDGLSLYGLAFGASLAASVVGMVGAGIVADHRGPRRPFVLGLALFVVGLVVAGAAPSMGVLVLGRAVKGIGIGMAIVTLYLLVDVYPDDLQPRVFAAFSAAWIVPALVGPALAGILVDQVHWRAVFLSVVAIAVPAAVIVRPAMPDRSGPSDDDPRRIGEVVGWSSHDRGRLRLAVTASTGVGAIHLTAQRTDLLGRAGLVMAVVATVAAARALLPPGTLRVARGLPAVIALRGIAGAAFFGAEVLVPLLLVTERSLSAALAGSVLTGGALGWSVGSWAQGRWPARDGRWARRGLAAVALGILVMSLVLLPAVPVVVAFLGWAVAGAGMGMVSPVLSVEVLRKSDPDDQGQNVSSLQLADSVATSTALAATGTLLALVGTSLAVFAAGLAIAAAIALAGTAATTRMA